MNPPLWCDVAFSPPEVPVRLGDAERARGARPEEVVCAVIDVLRATSTIVTALGNGCARILPFPSPETARAEAERLRAEGGADRVLLGGEVDAQPIPGFDGGNSPLEYSAGRVAGRDLLLSTSNGTKTLSAAGVCGQVYIVAFANLAAAAKRLAETAREGAGRTLLICCSGRKGAFCQEDAVAAGLLLEGVRDRLGEAAVELSDSAAAAVRVGGGAGPDLGRMLRESWWGRHLSSLDLDEDIEFCGRRDWTDVVPRMRGGAITAT